MPHDDSAKSLRTLNMKNLSLTVPGPRPARRPSVVSLPAAVFRREDPDHPVPYAHGPVHIIPGIWLGSEANARDWNGLVQRGIRSVLNVAKEVPCPLDPHHALRPVSSAPDDTYHPPDLLTGRPAMHYLKLHWSHGQQDLVHVGFHAAMAFTDAALARGDAVLIHCQCGISRSATMVIALVMRAAAEQSPSVPPQVWALKGMQGAYAYVKQKSKSVSPNMSLIYQLLDYEKKLKHHARSPSPSSFIHDDAEWGRQRKLFDDMPDDDDDDDPENTFIIREAQALDKAMHERVLARQSSASSLASSSNSAVPACRIPYANQRKRTGSIASSATACSSSLSDDLVEQEQLLGVRRIAADPSDSSASPDDDNDDDQVARASVLTPKTTCKPIRSTFTLPPPPTATRSSFHIPPPPPPVRARPKRRPAPIGILPPVPSSPVPILLVESSVPSSRPISPPPPQALSLPPASHSTSPPPPQALSLPPVRVRTTSSILPPPLHLRNTHLPTPSQTLFVFPPSPTTRTRTPTPSTMTLTSNTVRGSPPVPFPSLSTPRVSRTPSFVGIAAPTTAFSKVDARGYVALE